MRGEEGIPLKMSTVRVVRDDVWTVISTNSNLLPVSEVTVLAILLPKL